MSGRQPGSSDPVDFVLSGVDVETDDREYRDVVAVRTHGDTLWIVGDPERVTDRTPEGPPADRLWRREADEAVPWRRVRRIDRGPASPSEGGSTAGGSGDPGSRGGPNGGDGAGDRRGDSDDGDGGDQDGPIDVFEAADREET